METKSDAYVAKRSIMSEGYIVPYPDKLPYAAKRKLKISIII